jgi:serine protease
MPVRAWPLVVVVAALLPAGWEGARPRPGPDADAEAREPRSERPRRPAAPRPGEPLLVRGRGPSPLGIVPGQVIVRFAPQVEPAERAQLARRLGAADYRPARFADFARLAVGAQDDVELLAERLRAEPGVEWAEPDRYCSAAVRQVTAAAVSFNDPLFPRQWTFARLRLAEALERNPRRGEGVIVAVIDTGVAFGSGGAFPARRGLDLEGTSFAPGFDFVAGDAEPFDEGSALDDDDPFRSPRFGHGTFVAGQIAATVDNLVAGASVAPRAAIMPLRVLDVDGFGTFSDVAEAIRFATERGARVINMSLSGEQGTTPLQEAVREAHRRGVIVVAAAGNQAADQGADDDVRFPARYPEVVAVGATRFDDRRASYSNRGAALEIMAPAGDDLAEVAPGLRDGALSVSFLHDPVSGAVLDAAFFATGTSFAAPQVAGAAALLVGLGVNDPEAVRFMLSETARDLGAAGHDRETGFGLADLLAAHRGLGFSF